MKNESPSPEAGPMREPSATDVIAKLKGALQGWLASNAPGGWIDDLRLAVERLTQELDTQHRLKEQALDELTRIRNTPTTWDDGHAAGYRSAEHNFKARLAEADAALLVCQQEHGLDYQFIAEDREQLKAELEATSQALHQLVEELRARTWLSPVSAQEMNTRDRWLADRVAALLPSAGPTQETP